MAPTTDKTSAFVPLLILLLFPRSYSSEESIDSDNFIPRSDVDLLEFPLNLEFLEAEFFLYGAFGYGLDKVAPKLTQGGPTPTGVRWAHLDPFTRDVIKQFAYQEGNTLDLSAASFAKVADSAFGSPLHPPFDPGASGLHFLLASYHVPYVGLTGYVRTIPKLRGLLPEGYPSIAIYEHSRTKVPPYGITVEEFTNRFSALRDRLGHAGLKDEGLVVPPSLGGEGRSMGNVLAGDADSVAYDRTPEEILRIVYGGGNEHVPDGFYPKGANGRIARSHLQAS
ncbi:Desiccation-related protein PCC13-62 [Morella rubra]|uniref:Desiccation-related protein PCC13-62 n=1 Tax=Morella rubra TaxID=262757 RepID=A0A6A1UNA0_9ROSI|nr:Desiccation-related protein PCC13-62 [Morella rubra]